MLAASQIALIYKCHWTIELLFKQIKQTSRYGIFGQQRKRYKNAGVLRADSTIVNGCHWQKAATKKSFANMITVIRLHLMSYVELFEFIKDTYKAWRKTHNAPIAFTI